MKEMPVCIDKRKCFAKRNGKCVCLIYSYEESGECPFCKPAREVTKGKYYAIKRDYAKLA